MGYNDFWQHRYKITRVSELGHEISSEIVTGSRTATSKLRDLEEQGQMVVVFNLTKGIEEHRTKKTVNGHR